MKKYTKFATLQELKNDPTLIDSQPGIYSVFYIGESPKFSEVGTGGHFKKRNPNVSLSILESNWIKGVEEIYIGKATNLRKRIGTYLKFGEGRPVGHWGGRFIWQIADSNNIVFAWKDIENQDPREVEKELISQFKKQHGKRPFANLVG